MTDQEGHPAVVVLNRAFAADPAAVYCLITARFPCNAHLADDPTVVVQEVACPLGSPTVGTLGLINGILREMGMPLVASRWSEKPDASGNYVFLGFMQYDPPL